jgi:PPP family 3-phenylpropionic acid transporter
MSSATGLRLFYALMFVGTGASLPYLPVWLRAHGLDGAAIGAVLAAPQLARVATGQLAARWADRFRQRRTALMLLACVAAVSYASLLFGDGPLTYGAAWFVGSTAAAVMIPLTDVLTLRLARREGFIYGRLRAIGSLAFIAANMVMGVLLTRGSPSLLILWLVTAAALTALSVRLLLPPEPEHEAEADRPPPARLAVLLRNRPFLLAIIASGLIQAAHAFHYGFSALVWKAQGFSETVTGALWATGVGAEVLFLWFLEGWRERMGPERLLMLAGAASVLRWTISAMAPPLAVLFPLQLLHALTFAAAFLASLHLVHRLAPPESASAAQTLSASLSSGLFIGLATLASGRLFDAFGPLGYLAMTAMAAAGLFGAWRLPGRGGPAEAQPSSPSPASSSR